MTIDNRNVATLMSILPTESRGLDCGNLRLAVAIEALIVVATVVAIVAATAVAIVLIIALALISFQFFQAVAPEEEGDKCCCCCHQGRLKGVAETWQRLEVVMNKSL